MTAYKHRLLGTSALAAAMTVASGVAAAAEMKPFLSLGGFANHSTHFVSQDNDKDKGSVSHRLNTEVFFNMGGELDNGLKIGGRIELEALDAGQHIDASWVDISSDWGMVRLGFTNSGRYSHTFAVAAPNVAYGVSSGVDHFWFDDPGAPEGDKGTSKFRFLRTLGSVNTDIGDDDAAITYFTPRFNGFQLSATHRPEAARTGGSLTRVANEAMHYNNALDGSIHYSGSVGGVGVAFMAGAATADAPTGTGRCGEEDYQSFDAGIRLGVQGFSIGGQFADVDDEHDCGTGTAYHVGASYQQGPMGFSVTALDGEVEQNPGGGNAEKTLVSVGASYSIGPGIKAIASYQDVEVTGDSGETNAGQAVLVGLNLAF